jgi:hypothetical protein
MLKKTIRLAVNEYTHFSTKIDEEIVKIGKRMFYLGSHS